jgi:hypothetical protein
LLTQQQHQHKDPAETEEFLPVTRFEFRLRHPLQAAGSGGELLLRHITRQPGASSKGWDGLEDKRSEFLWQLAGDTL